MEIQESISSVSQGSPQMIGFVELSKKAIAIAIKKFWVCFGVLTLSLIGVSIFLFFSIAGAGLLAVLLALFSMKWLVFIIILLFCSVMVAFFSIWPSLAIIYIAKERDRNVGVLEALKKTFSKILPGFWISLLANLTIMIGLVLLIVPGLIFWVWFSLIMPVLVSENLRGVKALSRSKELVRGKGWKVFTMLLGLLVIALLVNVVTEPLFESDSLVEGFIGWLIMVPLILFFNIFIFLLYENLRKIKEQSYERLEKTEERI